GDVFGSALGQVIDTGNVFAVSGFLMGELAESLGFDGQAVGDQLMRQAANDNVAMEAGVRDVA
ncbi:MAG: hypothetical protein ACK5NL_21235, partial [Vibrio fluvialis]